MSGGIRNEDDLNYMAKLKEQDKPRYTPGQRLNSAAEVMQALLDGEKITSTSQYLKFFHMVDGAILNDDGFPKRDLSLDWQGYSIYTPPKRTREVTVWVNVYESLVAYHVSEELAEFSARHGAKALAVAVPHTFTIEY